MTLVRGDVTSVKGLSLQMGTRVAHMIPMLQLFMDVTELLCAEVYPTLLVIIPILDGVRNLLELSLGGLDIRRAIYVRLLDGKFGRRLVCCHDRRPTRWHHLIPVNGVSVQSVLLYERWVPLNIVGDQPAVKSSVLSSLAEGSKPLSL